MIKWNTPSCHCFFRGGAIPGAYQPGCWGALVHLEKWSNLIAEIHRLIYIQLHWQAVRTNDANSKKKLYTRDGTKVLDLGHHDFPTDIGHPFNNIPLRYLHAMVLTLDILRPPGIPITPAKILNIPIILRVTTFIQGKPIARVVFCEVPLVRSWWYYVSVDYTWSQTVHLKASYTLVNWPLVPLTLLAYSTIPYAATWNLEIYYLNLVPRCVHAFKPCWITT